MFVQVLIHTMFINYNLRCETRILKSFDTYNDLSTDKKLYVEKKTPSNVSIYEFEYLS